MPAGRAALLALLALAAAMQAGGQVLPAAAAPTPAAAPAAQPATAPASSGSAVLISELQTSNKITIKDEDGTASDWLELFNSGSSTVSLAGYRLTDTRDHSGGWAFPSGVSIAPGQYLLVFASGKNRSSASGQLHTDFKLSADDGYLALLAPDSSVASEVQFPDIPTDVSFGLIGSTGVVSAAQERTPQYALLAAPTPGRENSGPRPGGPLIVGTTRTAIPRPTGGADIPVSATVLQQQSPLASVDLVYVTNYGDETPIAMTAQPGSDTYTASIPAAAAPVGALVRWFVQATDAAGQVTRDPPFRKDSDRQYWGTIVEDGSDQSSLPVMELYCKDDKAPWSKSLVDGCSLWFNGSFYDNIQVGRRGVTSMNWPKPKIKLDSKQGSIFKIRPGMTVGEINLNSEWWEPGENSFMREPLVWETFRQMGVQSLVSFNLHIRMNGAYWGKMALVEQMDEDTLKRWGYKIEPEVGPLWKSLSGEYSNLRWDVPADQLPYYWQQYTRKKDNASEGQALLDFARGLSGGAPVPRSKYLFDAVNLPQVINHMAAQTLVLNQDRCTKNFFIYRDPDSGQWSMFPWDVESGFGSDRGLGGKPAPDYCILECEQWSSPLYCDENHPQDLAVKTPWGLISATYDLWTPEGQGQGRKLLRATRRLMQGAAAHTTVPEAAVPQNGAAAPGLTLPANSTIEADYDVDQTKLGPTKTGAPGTYNYLIDAILDVPRTRQMYMRRLRTLMDAFQATGRLQQIITDMYNTIRDEAKRDAAKWQNPGDPDRGYQQLVSEQVPIRKRQLYEQYGPRGPIPLIPDAQPSSFQLSLGRMQPGVSGFVEVLNPNGFAVDVSGYALHGAVSFEFAPGTVIPAQDSLFAAASVGQFKQRTAAPTGGQGAFVVGPLQGQLLGAAASVQLVSPSGAVVART